VEHREGDTVQRTLVLIKRTRPRGTSSRLDRSSKGLGIVAMEMRLMDGASPTRTTPITSTSRSNPP